MRRVSFAAALLLGLCATPAPGAEPTCADAPGAQVFSFAAPPPATPAMRAAFRAGRAYLRRGEERAPECAQHAAGLPGGYVVATLGRGQVSFEAPEPIPGAARICLERVVQRLGPLPSAFATVPAPQAGDAGPRPQADLEVRAVWVLRGPAAGPAPPPNIAPLKKITRRSFAEIEAEVGRHLPGIVSCLGELWEERPHAAGTLVLRFTIAESGVVEDVAVLRREPSMQAVEPCLLRVAGRMRFAPRWGEGRTLLSYPLVLTAAEVP